MIDLHCDTIMQLINHPDKGDLMNNCWKIDIEKLKRGGYYLQDFALFVELDHEADPYARYEAMRQVFAKQMELYSPYIRHVKSYDEYEACRRDGVLGALLSVEEGGVFGGSLEKLKKAYDDGVRLITISWNFPNGLSYPHGQEYEGKGLTKTGVAFVEYMEELGIMVDCSHLNDAGMFQLVDMMKKPLIASHSNARALTPHTRNLTDEQIRSIAEKGGVIGLNFAQAFLGESRVSQIRDMVRHTMHIYQVGGSDVLALGTDFDGIRPDTEIENAADVPRLFTSLAEAGLPEEAIEKMAWRNAERVMKEWLA